MTYQIHGLSPEPFRHLYGLTDVELAAKGVIRMPVTNRPGFPCRITLEDAEVGSQVLLLNHVSHETANPYRASHAIFVKEGADHPAQYAGRVPPVFAVRTLSLRGFDEAGMMVDALLALPGEAESGIQRLFADPEIAYIHAHNATRGCFAALVERA
jgi:hypothetical protein